MDIISHGLWAGLGAKLANRKDERRNLKFCQAFGWGIFPDLFAFTIPFVWLAFALLSGSVQFSVFSAGSAEPPEAFARYPVFALASDLYNISHSLVIFAVIFLLAWLIRKKPYWELCGWGLHILLDIPTHTAEFYATPVFWPVSAWKFVHGFSWGTLWFVIPNYVAISIVYLLLRKSRQKILCYGKNDYIT